MKTKIVPILTFMLCFCLFSVSVLGYTGWKTQKETLTLYYKAGPNKEKSKKATRKGLVYYKNGVKQKSKWIDGKYVCSNGLVIADKKGTLKSFLQTGAKPVGRVAYVWGGGWPSTTYRNDVHIGMGKNWASFYKKAKKSYNYMNHTYQFGNGLDCSGFVNWTIYNTVNTKSNGKSFTTYARNTGKSLGGMGLGKTTSAKNVKSYRPGDIMYNHGHVWISLGTCSDGSVLVMHSSPKGVQINGTPTKKGNKNSKAVKLAKKYMKKYRPGWKFDYPVKDYLGKYNRFSWTYRKLLTDPDGWRNKTGEQIIKLIW